MLKSGKFGAIEKRFFRDIEEQIATGRATLTYGVDAVLTDYAEPAPHLSPAA